MPAKKRTRAAVETTNNHTIDSFFKASDKSCDPPITKKPNLSGDPETSVSPVNVKKSEAQGKLWARKLGAGSLGPSWMKALVPEFKKEYFTKLMEFVKMERVKNTIYPPAVDVFSWTNTCPIDDVKVVILGQDPYHGDGQAHGLCFSVRVGVPPPPSLNNIYKELKKDIIGFVKPAHGHLEGWAKQGVLLLNACLTVRAKQPNSHSKQGWEQFTDAVILWLNTNMNGLVFILWGANAQKKGSSIDKSKHHVLTAPHPSPFSASKGFFGCKHFSSANQLLVEQGQTPIDWSYLPETI